MRNRSSRSGRRWLAHLSLVLGTVFVAVPASALSDAVSIVLTDITTDTFGTGLGVGSVIPFEFTASGCTQGDTACFDYWGGDPVTGGYFYDYPFYASVDIGSETIIGNMVAGTYDYGDTAIQNSEPGAGVDSIYLEDWTDFAVALPDTLGDPSADTGQLIVSLSLTDTDGAALSDGGVPDSLPPLGVFESSAFSVYVRYLGQTFQANGVVQGAQNVPEPSSFALLVGGLAAAARAGRRPDRGGRI